MATVKTIKPNKTVTPKGNVKQDNRKQRTIKRAPTISQHRTLNDIILASGMKKLYLAEKARIEPTRFSRLVNNRLKTVYQWEIGSIVRELEGAAESKEIAAGIEQCINIARGNQ